MSQLLQFVVNQSGYIDGYGRDPDTEAKLRAAEIQHVIEQPLHASAASDQPSGSG